MELTRDSSLEFLENKGLRWQTCTVKSVQPLPSSVLNPSSKVTTKRSNTPPALEGLQKALRTIDPSAAPPNNERGGLVFVERMSEVGACVREAGPKWETWYGEAMRSVA